MSEGGLGMEGGDASEEWSKRGRAGDVYLIRDVEIDIHIDITTC